MENLSFILTCLAIFAGLMLVAWLLQKLLCRDTKPLTGTHYITYTAMFACMAGVLMLLEIPLPFAPPFYKIDLSELPIMICTFYLGPVAGVTAELIKVLVKLLLKGTTTAFVGDFANFAVGCSFVLPASLVYHARPGKRSALIGLIVGTLCMTVFGSAFNGQRLQRDLPAAEIRRALRHADGRDHRHGHQGQRAHQQRLDARALRGRALQSAQGRNRLGSDLPAVQAHLAPAAQGRRPQEKAPRGKGGVKEKASQREAFSLLSYPFVV